MALKLITFDVTGTILSLRQPVGFQYAKIGSLYGLNASAERLSDSFRLVFKKLSVEHPNFGESCIGWESWWKELVSLTFHNSIQDKTLCRPQTMDQISKHLIEIFKTEECWKLVQGSQNLLEKLCKNNKRLGVLSNYDPRLQDILVNLKVHDYFDFVITSYSAKCSKPNVGIFKAVEEKNIDINKNEILHIGDSPQLDFVGAKNAGWHALLVTNNIDEVMGNHPNTKESEDWVVNSLIDIYDFLGKKCMI